MKAALSWRKGHRAEGLFEGVWQQLQNDLEQLCRQKLQFRGGRLPVHWAKLVRLAAEDENCELRLVSDGDLRFWESAYKRPTSEAAKYCEPVAAFRGKKSRLLILRKEELRRHHEARQRANFVVENMVADGIRVRVAWRSCAEGKKRTSFEPVRLDFGIIGNVAVSEFEAIADTESPDEVVLRALVEELGEDALRNAETDWELLLECVEWDSEKDGTKRNMTFRQFLEASLGADG